MLTVPLEFIWPIFWLTIVFWLTNANPSFVVFLFSFFAVMLNILAMQAVGLAISAGVPQKHQMTVTILLITYYFGYSGLFMPMEQLPVWIRWVEHLNLLLYSYHLLLKIIFTGDRTFSCFGDSSATDFPTCIENRAYRITDADIFDRYSVDKSVATCVGFAVGTIFVMRAVSFVFLARAVRRGPSD